jgi:hypothetical protein
MKSSFFRELKFVWAVLLIFSYFSAQRFANELESSPGREVRPLPLALKALSKEIGDGKLRQEAVRFWKFKVPNSLSKSHSESALQEDGKREIWVSYFHMPSDSSYCAHDLCFQIKVNSSGGANKIEVPKVPVGKWKDGAKCVRISKIESEKFLGVEKSCFHENPRAKAKVRGRFTKKDIENTRYDLWTHRAGLQSRQYGKTITYFTISATFVGRDADKERALDLVSIADKRKRLEL